MGAAAKIDYSGLERERQVEMENEFQLKLEQKAKPNAGTIDSLQGAILNYVVESNYDMAVSELNRYVEEKSQYPSFTSRVDTLVRHCSDIISAIRAKREFPGLGSLSTSKHQELFEKVIEHFEELKHYLKKIEVIEKEVKLDDIRSTVYVLKAFYHSLFVIVGLAFLQQFVQGGLANTFNVVMDDIIIRLLHRVFDFF